MLRERKPKHQPCANPFCERQIYQPAYGQQRRTCSNACRQKLYRLRKKGKLAYYQGIRDARDFISSPAKLYE